MTIDAGVEFLRRQLRFERQRAEEEIARLENVRKTLLGELCSLQEDFNIYARDICEPLKKENKRLREALRKCDKGLNYLIAESDAFLVDDLQKMIKEALGDG